jgi:hypothetical protein
MVFLSTGWQDDAQPAIRGGPSQAGFAHLLGRSMATLVGMSAYRDALHIEPEESGSRLKLAVELLSSRRAVVLVGERLALRPMPDRILCEVITQTPEPSRSPSAHRAEVESAKRMFNASTIKNAVESEKLEWLVVDDYGTGTVELWHAN